jgi:hypothetical protein
MVCTPAAPRPCSAHRARRSKSSPCEGTCGGGGGSPVAVVFDAASGAEEIDGEEEKKNKRIK